MLKSWLNGYIKHYRGFNQAIWLNIFAIFIQTLGFIPGTFFALYLVEDKSVAVHATALLLSFCSGLAIFGAYLGGWLGDRHSPTRICQISLGLLAILLILFPLASHFLMLLVGAGALFFVYSIFNTRQQHHFNGT